MTARTSPVAAHVPAGPLLVGGHAELPCPAGRAATPAEAAGIALRYDPAHLLTWLRLRFGLRRCLACGRFGFGNRSLHPAHPLVSPATARTWTCIDPFACRRRRTRTRRGPDVAEANW